MPPTTTEPKPLTAKDLQGMLGADELKLLAMVADGVVALNVLLAFDAGLAWLECPLPPVLHRRDRLLVADQLGHHSHAGLQLAAELLLQRGHQLGQRRPQPDDAGDVRRGRRGAGARGRTGRSGP